MKEEEMRTTTPTTDAVKALGEVDEDANPEIRAAYRKHVEICTAHHAPIVPWAIYRGEMEEYPELVDDSRRKGVEKADFPRGKSSLNND